MMRGYEQWQKDRLKYDAWKLANLIQPHTKKRIRPEDLIKPRKKQNARQDLKSIVLGTSEKDKDLKFLTMLKKRSENGSRN